VYPSEMAAGPIEKLKDAEGLLPKSIIPLQRAGTEEDSTYFPVRALLTAC
jgi:hypothetical protein